MREMNAPVPDRFLPALLLALTALTGLVDAVSYLALGHVFTANMTGNVVFLGFAMADTPGLSLSRSGAALAAFVVGATVGGRLAVRIGIGPRLRWTSVGFVVEAILLLAAAALATGAGHDLLQDLPRTFGLIVLTGLAMGVRNAVVRKLAERDLTTTVLTMTITGLAADSPFGGGKSVGLTRRALSVALMFGGAVAGAWLLRYSIALPLAVSGIVSAVCALGLRLRAASALSAR
jgi:uncharacterized membrane protein YoaK (UPF0700 family)